MQTIILYKDMKGTCSRDSGTTRNISNGTVYEGICITFPTVGTRFTCGPLSTNIVVEIVESNKDMTRGKFRTLSNSIYNWEITEMGDILKEITYEQPVEITEALLNFKNGKKI